jgi:Fe-S-cluster containining protein
VPAKGQSCVNCKGDCCSIVTFIGDTGISLSKEIMDFSVNELRELGFQEDIKHHKPCAGKNKDVCLIYDDRPRLCRSYYCHGRH